MALTLQMSANLDAKGVTLGATQSKAAIESIAGSTAKTTSQLQTTGTAIAKLATQYRGLAGAQQRTSNTPIIPPNTSQQLGLANHQVTNLSYQMNDIAVMLASGQSPFVMMMQQGGQISQIFGQRGLGQILPALGQGIMSLISPTTLFLAGITAAGYAAHAVYTSIRGEVLSTDEVLEQHTEFITRIKDAYATASEGVKQYGEDGAAVFAFMADEHKKNQQKALQDELANFKERLAIASANRRLLEEVQSFVMLTPEQTTYEAGGLNKFFEVINNELDKTSPNITKLREELVALTKTNPDLTSLVSQALELSETSLTLTKNLEELNSGILETGKSAKEMADDFGKSIDKLHDFGKRLTEMERLTKIYKEALKDANREGDVMVAQHQYQQAIARLKQNEADKRIPVPTFRPNDYDWDKRPSDELLEAGEKRIEQLRHELGLIGETSSERLRQNALMEAEISIREKNIDTNGAAAESIRKQALEIANLSEQLEKNANAYNKASNAGRSMIDDVAASLRAGDFEGLIDNITDELLKLSTDVTFTNPLKNMLYGDNLPTIQDMGGVGGMFQKMFGDAGKPTDLLAGMNKAGSIKSTGSMSVAATSVVINGNVLGGEGLLSELVNPANNNGKSFLDLIGKAEGTDRGRGYNETLAYGKFTGGDKNLVGMSLDQIDALQTKMLNHPENDFNSSALGRYQIVQKTLRGLREQLNLSGDQKFDAGLQDQLATALINRRGANVDGLRNEWEGLRNVSGDQILSTFNQSSKAIKTLGHTADLTKGQLGNMGQGFNSFASMLSQVPAGNASGGGGSLFSSLVSSIGGNANISPAANAAFASGAGGLFNNGGFTGDIGADKIAGFVHGNEYVFDAVSTKKLGIGTLEALRNNALRGYMSGGAVQAGGFSMPQSSGMQSGTTSNPSSGLKLVVNNFAGAEVSAEQSTDDGGDDILEITLDRVGENISNGGYDGQMQRYGSKPKGAVLG